MLNIDLGSGGEGYVSLKSVSWNAASSALVSTAMDAVNGVALQRAADDVVVSVTLDNATGKLWMQATSFDAAGDVDVEGTPVEVMTVSADRAWAFAATTNAGYFVVIGATDANTVTAKSYTRSGTTMTLDATDTETVTGYAEELVYALCGGSATRLMAVIPHDTATGRRRAHGITVGSGSVAFDASGTHIIASTSDDPGGYGRSGLVRKDADEYVFFGADSSSGDCAASHILDNGSGTPPTVGSAGVMSINIGEVYGYCGMIAPDASAVACVAMDSAYVTFSGAASLSGSTITAIDAGYGGCPNLPAQAIALPDMLADKFQFIMATRGVGTGDYPGVEFGEVDTTNLRVRFGYNIDNTDGKPGVYDGDVCALTTTRFIHAYPKTSTGYPTLRSFDI